VIFFYSFLSEVCDIRFIYWVWNEGQRVLRGDGEMGGDDKEFEGRG
jgi:hypothetical protein